jgi:hypothetical protein
MLPVVFAVALEVMLKLAVVPEVSDVLLSPTYFPVEVPVMLKISKRVLVGIVVPPLFLMSTDVQLPVVTFLYTPVTTKPYEVVEGVAEGDVSGDTQYQTATADITAIAINNTVATTGETPFLIINASNKSTQCLGSSSLLGHRAFQRPK